jgi:hypothetical protein
MRPTKTQIRAMSTTIGTLLFTIASILIIGPMSESHVFNRVIAAVIAGLSIERMMAFSHTLLVKWWANDLLGEWFYFSNYSVSSHFAHSNIYVRGGELHYQVDLYELKEITAIANGSTKEQAKAVGHAVDRAIFYDGDEVVEILYEVERHNHPSGQGVLKVNLNNSKRTMSGYWVTARDDEGPRSGRMQWYRRDEFLAFLKEQTSAQ